VPVPDTQRAYALKENAPELAGYTLAYGEGDTVDVKQLLDDGAGVIVTGDPLLITEFDASAVLKRVAVPDPAKSDKKAEKAANTDGEES